VRSACDAAAPAGAGPQEGDVPLRRPRHAPDRRSRRGHQGRRGVRLVNLSPNPVSGKNAERTIFPGERIMQEIKVIDSGRGPRIPGTRVTVYDVIPYLEGGDTPPFIADVLSLSTEEVLALIQYIEDHK